MKSSIRSVASTARTIVKPAELTESQVSEIASKLSRVYTDDPKEKRNIITTLYATNSIFIDPLVSVKGRLDIYAQFYMLGAMNVTHVVNSATSELIDSKSVVTVDNTQVYGSGYFTVKLNASTRLDLGFYDGKWLIEKHADKWLDYERVDLIPSFGKAIFGWTTSNLCRIYLKVRFG